VYQSGYLLITAAWLYTLSFLFTNYWSYRSSPAKVKTSLEKRLSEENKSIEALAANTEQLIRRNSTYLPVSISSPIVMVTFSSFESKLPTKELLIPY
jgi:hypothetical protein